MTFLNFYFQITKEANQILSAKGYPTKCRGAIQVKGKGSMETFFLEGPAKTTAGPNIIVNPLENLSEKVNQYEKSMPTMLGTISERN